MRNFEVWNCDYSGSLPFGLGSPSRIGKMVHLFTVRPTNKCGSNSPLHPLFVCNGETDCLDGRDEINCTQGMLLYNSFSLRHMYVCMDVCTLFDPLALMQCPCCFCQKPPALQSDTSATAAPAFWRRMLSAMVFMIVRTTVTRPAVVSGLLLHAIWEDSLNLSPLSAGSGRYEAYLSVLAAQECWPELCKLP